MTSKELKRLRSISALLRRAIGFRRRGEHGYADNYTLKGLQDLTEFIIKADNKLLEEQDD